MSLSFFWKNERITVTEGERKTVGDFQWSEGNANFKETAFRVNGEFMGGRVHYFCRTGAPDEYDGTLLIDGEAEGNFTILGKGQKREIGGIEFETGVG